MDVILDTCALLSLAGVADKSLSKVALQSIRDANSVYLSASSCFELSLKYKRGNLRFPHDLDPRSFWSKCIEAYLLSEVPVSSLDFSAAVGLPDHHADPFDRIIIAQAARLKAKVISYDKVFKAYGVSVIS